MDTHHCITPTLDRRRHFWTTQPSSCGVYADCRKECGLPGLELVTIEPATGLKSRTYDPNNATIATNDWVRGLLLNIFNTIARMPSSVCGNQPGRQGGHWSESYGDGTYIGTHMYEQNPISSFRDALALLKARVAKDAFKLVTYGVATAVNVSVTYLGGSRVSVDVEVIGPVATEGVVNLKVERIDNAWVWR